MGKTTRWSVTNTEKSDRMTPRTVEVMAGFMRIVITRHIHFSPDAWIYVFDGHVIELKARDLEDAKKEALVYARAKLNQALAAIGLLLT